MSETYQFEVAQGPITLDAWYAWSLGRELSDGLDRLDKRGVRPGAGGQYRLAADGGREVSADTEHSGGDESV